MIATIPSLAEAAARIESAQAEWREREIRTGLARKVWVPFGLMLTGDPPTCALHERPGYACAAEAWETGVAADRCCVRVNTRQEIPVDQREQFDRECFYAYWRSGVPEQLRSSR